MIIPLSIKMELCIDIYVVYLILSIGIMKLLAIFSAPFGWALGNLGSQETHLASEETCRVLDSNEIGVRKCNMLLAHAWSTI